MRRAAAGAPNTVRYSGTVRGGSAAARWAYASAAAGEPKAAVKSVTVVTSAARDRGLKSAVKRAAAVGKATTYTRDLVNQAPNDLYPATFAAEIKKRAVEAPSED